MPVPQLWCSHRQGLCAAALLLVLALSGQFRPLDAGQQTAAAQAVVLPQPVTRSITLVAEPGTLTIRRGQTVPVWTYNGTVPGPEIRVYAGDSVRVTLVNHLPQATTIHWHGLLGPNSNDGVAGVTQNAVLPGHSYTYRFVARDPGTYWYHPHQNSDKQLDKGLYGALVILPRQAGSSPQIDRTLLLDDWPLAALAAAPMQGMTMPGMSAHTRVLLAAAPTTGRATSASSALAPYLADRGMETYQTFTINGHAYPDTTPLDAAPGTRVRLRLINAGYLTHILHLHGVTYRLVATDGHAVAHPQETRALLPIAPAQRMDIEFQMPQGTWSLHDHNGLAGAAEMRLLLGQAGQRSAADQTMDHTTPPLLDVAHYGQPATAAFTLHSRFDQTFQLVLQKAPSASAMGGMSDMTGMAMDAYTINGRLFMKGDNLIVRRGQRIALVFVNKSQAAHPMHLHGHRFQVLTLNGVAVTGAPLYQDTVMVLPGKTTVVAFVANNPGIWMLHCHELHHAAAGMDIFLAYQGSPRLAQLGGPAHNNPE